MCKVLSIDEAAIQAVWPRFVEAKARRDLGMHNAWRCNSIYLRKLAESGIASTLKEGESAAPSDDVYVRQVDHALDELADMITKLVMQKHWPHLTHVVEAAGAD